MNKCVKTIDMWFNYGVIGIEDTILMSMEHLDLKSLKTDINTESQ